MRRAQVRYPLGQILENGLFWISGLGVLDCSGSPSTGNWFPSVRLGNWCGCLINYKKKEKENHLFLHSLVFLCLLALYIFKLCIPNHYPDFTTRLFVFVPWIVWENNYITFDGNRVSQIRIIHGLISAWPCNSYSSCNPWLFGLCNNVNAANCIFSIPLFNDLIEDGRVDLFCKSVKHIIKNMLRSHMFF